jgi:hypothetical protein
MATSDALLSFAIKNFPSWELVRNLKITKIGSRTGNSWHDFEFPAEGFDVVPC